MGALGKSPRFLENSGRVECLEATRGSFGKSNHGTGVRVEVQEFLDEVQYCLPKKHTGGKGGEGICLGGADCHWYDVDQEKGF